MVKMKTIVTALSGVLTGGMLLAGGLAFAGDTDSSVSKNFVGKMPFFGQEMKHRGGMMGGKGFFKSGSPVLSDETLDQLVKEEAITQAKADEIKAYIEKIAQERQAADPGTRPSGRQDLFTGLVTNKILTQDQADNIQTKIRELATQQHQHQQQISDILKTLVEKGTITQEQSDKILKQYADAEKNREELKQKMDNMTLKEIREYMQDNKVNQQNPMSQLVSDGVISQEQAAAFQAAMKEAAQKQSEQQLSDRLAALVKKGTINQEQFIKIQEALEKAHSDRDALIEKTKDMTPEERRQYMQDNKSNFQNPLNQLVEDGVITTEQLKSIGIAGPRGKGFGGGMR